MQRPEFPPSAAKPPLPDIPTILVEDRTVKPITTTHYIRYDNVLDFQYVYKKVKNLLRHPPCKHRKSKKASKTAWPCASCEKTFLDLYWSSVAYLLDYFADFYHLDTPTMHYCWFHLVDCWQQALDQYLPVYYTLGNRKTSPKSMQAFTKARWLSKHYEDTMDLLDKVVQGAKGTDPTREPIFHRPDGDYKTASGEYYNTGPYVSGLKPWEQWLCTGGGVVGEEKVCTIPAAAIAIMRTHTERAERLATQVNPDPDFLAAFKRNSIVFPKADGKLHSYTSMKGTTVEYRLENGAPPVMRPTGFSDPQLKAPKLDFHLADEYIGRSRGMESYEPVSGKRGDDGEWDDGFAPFDTWAVTENNGGDGKWRKEQSAGGLTGKDRCSSFE